MSNRLIVYLMIFITLFSIIAPINLYALEDKYWNKSYSFRKEIVIPIDTNKSRAKFQPIDITITFENLCWAINENQHSIRVIYQNANDLIEIDSQIYDLTFTDSEHISSCNIVFLIPEKANGNEKYYLYYDDEEKQSPDYEDKVKVEESTYEYEPIQGVGFESSYFLIKQNEEIIYGINWEGKFLGDPVSQQVAKFVKGATETRPKNGDHLVNFCFNYWRLKDDIWNINSTKERHIGSEILIDGNLMVKLGIVSESNSGLFKSTVIYKYYFCPMDDKRIFANVKHEVIDYPIPTGDELDVSYVTLYNGGLKSKSIDELNFGEIPPFLHFYSEDGVIKEFKMIQFPENSEWEEYISKEDDYDLGSKAWASVDFGETGKAHGVVLSTDKVIKSGTDERDGIELQLYEAKNLNYPGLDGRFSILYFMRNDYEKGEPRDVKLPQDFIIEFDALYFTTQNGGFRAVDEEADLFQKLIAFQPEEDSEIDQAGEKDKYNLKTYIHLSPDLIRTISLSNSLLKKPKISVELVYNDVIIAVKKPNRIPLNEDLRIDWRNISFFRKAQFPETETNRYVIKVWLENIIFKRQKQLIGYKIIDLDKDITTHIFCTRSGKIEVCVLDQEGIGISDVEITLQDHGATIANGRTFGDGTSTINAPCGILKSYLMNITYKGFLISSKNIHLGRIRQILPIIKRLDLDVYDLQINFKDPSGNIPSFEVEMDLISPEMDEPISLNVDKISSDAAYNFYSLYPANYTLKIEYRSFVVEETVQVSETKNIDIDLYDFTAELNDDWDLPPNAPLDITLSSKNFKRNVVLYPDKIRPGQYIFKNLYPGDYDLEVNYKEYSIMKPLSITSSEQKNITMDFSALFNLTAIVLDTRGNPINGADVKLLRDGQEVQVTTNNEGKARFSVPPGEYYIDMYNNQDIIASRKISVPFEKTYSIVTKIEPVLPYIVIATILLFLFFFGLYSYKRRQILFFIKILVVCLAIIALVTPWWELSGANSDSFSTTTELYIMPTEMITLTLKDNITAGDILPLDKEFTSVTDYLPSIIILGILCFIGGIVLEKLKKRKFSFIVYLAATVILFAASVVFIVATSELTNIVVGSVLGSGNIEIDIPGEEMTEDISCSWGFNLGLYLIITSSIISGLLFMLNLKMMIFKKNRSKET